MDCSNPQPRTWRCGGWLHVVRCAVPCIACQACFSRRPQRLPALFLLALLACVSAGACVETPGCWKKFAFDRLRRRRSHARNGHPFLRKKRRDKYLAWVRHGLPFVPHPSSTSFLILTTHQPRSYLYFLQLSLRDTSYYLPLQASESYPPIAAYNSTSY